MSKNIFAFYFSRNHTRMAHITYHFPFTHDHINRNFQGITFHKVNNNMSRLYLFSGSMLSGVKLATNFFKPLSLLSVEGYFARKQLHFSTLRPWCSDLQQSPLHHVLSLISSASQKGRMTFSYSRYSTFSCPSLCHELKIHLNAAQDTSLTSSLPSQITAIYLATVVLKDSVQIEFQGKKVTPGCL